MTNTETVGMERDRLIHILVVHFDMFRDKAEAAADLFLHDKTLASRTQSPAEWQVDDRTWLELREPGCVPERKGPIKSAAVADFLREIFKHRPHAYITVITQGHDGPLLQDGPECLQMLDGRSMGTGRKHIASTRAAHGSHATIPAPETQEPVAWVTKDILAAMKRGERAVPGWKPSADFCIPIYAGSIPASERSKEETGVSGADWGHIINEWADGLTNCIQWFRNIRDDMSSPQDALDNVLPEYERVLALSRAALETPPLHKEVEAVAWLHQPTGNVFKDGECQKLIEAWQRQFKDIPADEIAADFIPLYAALSAKPTGEV